MKSTSSKKGGHFRILEHGNGWCFTVMHFTDLGSDALQHVGYSLAYFHNENFLVNSEILSQLPNKTMP